MLLLISCSRAQFPARPFQRSVALVIAGSLAQLPAVVSAHAAPRPQAGEGAVEPAPGDAEARAAQQQAMNAYRRGVEHYNAASYAEALADFQEAASLYASPDFQYNIGACYEKLEKYDDAIRAFRTYLRAKPEAADRPNIEHRIAALERRLPDMRQQPREPADEPPPPAQPEMPAPVDRPDPGRPLWIAGAVLTGIGGAIAVGTGVGFGVPAARRSDALDRVMNGGNPEAKTYAEAQDLDREGRRFETAQLVGASIGSAIALGGIVLLALGLARSRRARADGSMAARATPNRTSFAPAIGPRGGELRVSLRF